MLYFLTIISTSFLIAHEPAITPTFNGELLPLYHDDQGFSSLHIPDNLYQKYNHDIPAFLNRLKDAFRQEFKGKKTERGIHMPDWIIWGFPSVVRNSNKLTLYIGNQSLNTPIKIGSLKLEESRYSVIDYMEQIRTFVNKYIDYDSIQYSGQTIPLVKQEFNENWTEIDDLIMQMLLKRANYKLSDKDQDESYRLIGEFFRWRKLIAEFCQKSFSRESDASLPEQFENFLVKGQKIPEKEAITYKYILDIRRQQLGLLLKDPGSSSEVIDAIFENLTLYGLTRNQKQADRYKDELFPR